jgi:hypothetical protein
MMRAFAGIWMDAAWGPFSHQISGNLFSSRDARVVLETPVLIAAGRNGDADLRATFRWCRSTGGASPTNKHQDMMMMFVIVKSRQRKPPAPREPVDPLMRESSGRTEGLFQVGDALRAVTPYTFGLEAPSPTLGA